MKNNLDIILTKNEMKKDFDIFAYNDSQRTSAIYEGYIYQAIYGFEIDEIIKYLTLLIILILIRVIVKKWG